MTRMLIHTGVYVNDNEELRIHRRLNILFENVDTYEPVYCILTMEMWIRTFDMFELYVLKYGYTCLSFSYYNVDIYTHKFEYPLWKCGYTQSHIDYENVDKHQSTESVL